MVIGVKVHVRKKTMILIMLFRNFGFFQIEAASKLKCKLCPNKKFTSLKMYDDHMTSKKHRKNELWKDTMGACVCQACDLVLSSQSEWVSTVCSKILRRLKM